MEIKLPLMKYLLISVNFKTSKKEQDGDVSWHDIQTLRKQADNFVRCILTEKNKPFSQNNECFVKTGNDPTCILFSKLKGNLRFFMVRAILETAIFTEIKN